MIRRSSARAAHEKDVFDKWLDERGKIPTRGKITKKNQAIIYDEMLHEESPFAQLFDRKKKK